MSDQPHLTLNDDREMPQLGFGTWQVEEEDAAGVVKTALDVGYRLVDTAAIYENERGVGKGLEGREDIWLTTKIWNDDQGYAEAKTAFGHSLNRLGREDVDLLLIHWSCPQKDRFVDTWKAMIELREEGRAKSIGVSNFRREDLARIIEETGFAPAVNQIELHPSFQQRELRALHDELGIRTQSWSPLGQGKGMDADVVGRIAEETGQSPAAVIIRWHLQSGLLVIPKASSRAHMADNLSALDFTLSDAQMAAIDGLDRADGRIGPDPADYC
ncbi:aldo/keto reductase [Sphingomicrobium aestuariivivum]|uniref:aldo/keto reductase n=1 Tax=Sphingomicrobium aestuariivivum TaxID=1582356 RepID=UPI001FD64D06|nr:aldo/keto reductase [Sphingomicrobium aestuariivivum]MCJ8191546.1 aldo/keto reductase [Sphingomicrobium aestuariivivum]